MKWPAAALCVLVPLALGACGAQREEGPRAEGETAQAAHPGASPQPAAKERWLLSEFDWGDSEDVVYETVRFTDGFLCLRHKTRKHCAFVKTRVDGEELLAKFEFVDKKLWRIDVLTPDLDAAQSDQHLERVWKLLAAYVTRFHGEAPEQQPFPPRDQLVAKQDFVTHRWKLPEQEIRIVVGRGRKGEKWFTAARFTDPKWVKDEPVFAPAAAPASPQPSTASPTS
jgi:hypothetical protein